jgi:hypothetical protein
MISVPYFFLPLSPPPTMYLPYWRATGFCSHFVMAHQTINRCLMHCCLSALLCLLCNASAFLAPAVPRAEAPPHYGRTSLFTSSMATNKASSLSSPSVVVAPPSPNGESYAAHPNEIKRHWNLAIISHPNSGERPPFRFSLPPLAHLGTHV